MSIQRVDTLAGRGRVRLTDRFASVDYEIHVLQELDGGVPTRTTAKGNVKLPPREVALAMMARKPMALELEDGRKANILVIDVDGNIQVTGAIG